MLRDALYPYSSSTGRQVAVRISMVIDYLRAVGRVWKLPGHDLDLQDPKGELF